ncbi:MAG TPA: ABC transporter ATP-binding protein [Acidimicrobiia bacterium]
MTDGTRVPALEVDGLRVEFGRLPAAVQAVQRVSFSVDPGETVAVVGESGSGKSVTGLAIMGLVDPPGRITEGDVRLAGKPLTGMSESEYRRVRGQDLAMVFQDPLSALNPVRRVGDQIAEAARVHGASRAAARARSIDMLERVGVVPAARQARAYPHELSGGMRQRVMLAMALVNRPQVLIADEPTTALDVTTQAQILELLADLQAEMGLALVLVSHDLGVVAGIADRVLVMYAGRIVEEGPADRVFAAAGHPYTRGLLASVPRADDARPVLAAIPGTPPDPTALPTGCAFHPRCALAEDACRETRPELRALGEGHRAACLFADDVSVGARSL